METNLANASLSRSAEAERLTEAPSSLVRRIDRRGHAPGDILAGRYQIVGLLGEGGMGTVWRARSLSLDIDVAIKVLHTERADIHAAERLLREARATAKLGHPAIVRAFDLGETDAGEPFLVMELLEGMSLAAWLRGQGRMSGAQAVQMLLPIVGALAAAHKQGIVHRDIKPENIIVVPDGDGAWLPKIVDFGIAKLLDGGPRVDVLTQSGMILGSLEYMSPEQAEGRDEVGEQTDVWALCVVLYELISGHRPFDGPTVAALIYSLYKGVPTPTTRYSAGDDDLWKIIERGLQKSPEDRWPNMRALGQALSAWAVARGISTDAAGTSIEHHWLGRGSEPPIVRDSYDAISSAATSVAQMPAVETAQAMMTPVPEAPAAPVSEPVPRDISMTPIPAEDKTPRWRVRARILGPVALLSVFVPALVLAALHARSGPQSGEIRASEAPAWVRETEPVVTATPTVFVEPAAAPSATAAKAQEPAPARAAPSAPQRRVRTSMPLPATPNY